MDRPFPAYKGDEPYVFVSYSHKDSDAVFPEITRLKDQGVNIWYDEGIEAGTEWTEALAAAITRAELFLYFVTPDSAQSQNCRNEVNFAVEQEVSIVAVHLKKTDLPGGLSLTLSSRQAILKHEIPVKEYEQKLLSGISTYLNKTAVRPPLISASNGGPRKKTLPIAMGGLFVLLAVAVMFYLSSPRDDRSIAVLPFEDISPSGDQAYFGNGMADELRLELQGLDGLRVAGRTSSIASAQEDSKTIGETLNVNSILEGSIRKEGNNVRITVQLTNVADGFAIWSQSYNRELENIFEIQEEIAMSVAGALGVRLGVGEINTFRGAGTRNAEAYEAYLQSMHPRWQRDRPAELRLLERAIELDPNYAAAWAQLAMTTLSAGWNSRPDEAPEILERAIPFALKAVELNPESAAANSTLATLRAVRFDWIGAEQGHTRAIELLLDRPIVLRYGSTLLRNGRTAEAQTQYGIAESLEPLGGRPHGLHWHASLAQGKFAEAKKFSDWQDAANRIMNNLDIALNEGDPEGVKAAMRARPKSNVSTITLHTPVLAEFDSPQQVLSILRDVHADESVYWPRKLHDIAMLAAFFGDPEFALQVKGEEVRATGVRLDAVWYPVMSEARRLPAFKELVADLNLVEYWRLYGWADACHPLGDDDFTCI